MSHTREEVLELLALKRITPDEADHLLVAIDRKPGLRAWLANPLSCLSSEIALALTVVPVACQLYLERLGIHFDGALDIHTNGAGASWASAARDAAVGFPLLAAILWASTLLGRRAARIVDVAAAVGLSRWPLSIAALLLLPIAHGASGQALVTLGHPAGRAGAAVVLQHMASGDFALMLASIPFVIWSLIWIWAGFQTSTGERGARLGWRLVGGILAAEILSKLILRLAA